MSKNIWNYSPFSVFCDFPGRNRTLSLCHIS